MAWVDGITEILDGHTPVESVEYLGKQNGEDAIQLECSTERVQSSGTSLPLTQRANAGELAFLARLH
jgi:hypothetical protein